MAHGPVAGGIVTREGFYHKHDNTHVRVAMTTEGSFGGSAANIIGREQEHNPKESPCDGPVATTVTAIRVTVAVNPSQSYTERLAHLLATAASFL